MARLQRIEVWDDLECAGGVRKAVVRTPVSCQETTALDGRDELVVSLPLDDPSWPEITGRRVLRLTFDDDTLSEWRINKITSQRSDSLVGTVRAESVLLDLALGVLERVEADGTVWHEFELGGLTPTELVTLILTDAPSYFAVGTVNPTRTEVMSFDGDSPLSALRELAKLANAELAVRRNGSTNYLVDLVDAVGASAAQLDIRLRRNLVGLEYEIDNSELATRVYPRGAEIDGLRIHIGSTRWEVVSVASNDVTLVEPNGSEGPIAFDDQFNGLYLEKPNGTLTQITDTIFASQIVTVADATGLAGGNLVVLRATSGGQELTYLDDPAGQAAYGLVPRVLDRADVPYVRNLVANAELGGTYSGGLAPNWNTVGGPTLSENTSALFRQFGGKSQHVSAALDGDGIESDAVAIAPSAASPFFSAYVMLWVVSGTVRVELVDLTNARTYPTGAEGRAFTTEHNVWVALGVAGIDLNEVGSASMAVRVVADGDVEAEFYVDAAQITQSGGQQPFYPRDAALDLWLAGNNKLLDDGAPRVSVAVNLLDLGRLDETVWPYHDVTLGGDVRVVDPDIGVDVVTRIMRVARDLLTDTQTGVVLSNDPETLTDVVLRPRRRQRFGLDADAGFDRIGIADPAIGPAQPTPSSINYPISFDRETAYIEVYTLEAATAGGAVTPSETSEYFAGFIYPGTQNYEIDTTADYYRTTLFVAYTRDQVRGRSTLFSAIQASNSGSGPSGAPSAIVVGTETTTTIPITWTNGDATAETRVKLNGVVKETVAAGVAAYTFIDLTPNTTYQITCDHIKNGIPSAEATTVEGMTDSLGTLPTPSAFGAWGDGTDGVAFCVLPADETAYTVIERSDDTGGAPTGNWAPIKVMKPGATSTTHGSGSGTKHFRVYHSKSGWTDSSPTSANVAQYYVGETPETCV